MNPRIVGVVAGAAAAAVSIASNLWKNDPHLVSTAPDVVTALAMGVVLFVTLRFAVLQHPANAGRAGLHATLAAAIVFAVCTGTFTLWYLPVHSWALAAFSAGAGFLLVCVVGFAVTRMVASGLGRQSA